MKKITKLKICDWCLLILAILILISGIGLEAHLLDSCIWVWAHIVIGSLFIGFIIWHIYLHFTIMRNAFKSRDRKKKKPLHPWMCVFLLLTTITAIVTTIHWLSVPIHTPIGGVHGKFGFILLILICVHIYKKRKFYTVVN